MKFAKTVFAVAAVYGLVTLIPTYFLETRIGLDDPPPITHPEYFYGFLGVALAWQLLFIVVALDPPRYRPAMLAAFVEKLGFGGAAIALFAAHRVQAAVLGLGLVDLALGVLFVIAYATVARAVGERVASASPVAASAAMTAGRGSPSLHRGSS